jgi:hypothetical protein
MNTDSLALVNFSGIEPAIDQAPKNFTPRVSKTEYISGGYYNQDINRILFNSSGKLLKTFGDHIVDDMLRDAEIKKCETVLKISVLNDGITFLPAISKPARIKVLAAGETETLEQKRERLQNEKDQKRYELAVKYANFATRAINNLDTSIRTIMESMLDAITYGNKVAEQTYREEYNSDFGRTLLTLDSIRVKPRRNTHFVINKYNKVVGLWATVQNKDKSEQVVLPREKFLILTFRGKDGDPRGISILEAVYNTWMLKMQLWPEYLRWLLNCALPTVAGFTSPNAQKNVLRDAQTNEILKDDAGNPLYESDVASLLQALTSLRNNTAIALPEGAKIEVIQSNVPGDPFKGMRDVLNEEIEMGLILQTLATSEGRNMSRAAAQTHMSVLDLLVFFIKGLVCDMLSRDVLKPLFELNFANFDMDLLPKVSMGDSERRDWATDVIAIATGWKSNYFGESQKPALDAIIGVERDVESDRLFAAEQLAQQQQSAVANTKPAPAKPAKPLTAAMSERMLELKTLVQAYEKEHGEII